MRTLVVNDEHREYEQYDCSQYHLHGKYSTKGGEDSSVVTVPETTVEHSIRLRGLETVVVAVAGVLVPLDAMVVRAVGRRSRVVAVGRSGDLVDTHRRNLWDAHDDTHGIQMIKNDQTSNQ